MSLERINRIKRHKSFADTNTDAIFITKSENVLYVLGFKVESDVFMVVPKEDTSNTDGKIKLFLTALDYDEATKNIEADKDLASNIEILRIPSGEPNFIQNTVNKYKFKTIGYEDDYISVKKFYEWNTKYPSTQFIGSSDVLNDARLIKTQAEMDRMRKAGELGIIGFKAIYNVIKEGMTEKELAAEAEYEMRKAGSDGTSFDTIVASGTQSAFPHAHTSEKKVQDGDIIIVDIGSRYDGYCSDMTRTFIFGMVTPEKAKLVNMVNDAQQFGLDHIKAGLYGWEIDNIVRDFFKTNLPEWSSRFIHSLGHGVGIDIHESPYLSPVSQEILQEDMIVTVEPGLYIPGLGGARTEDQVVIKKDGFVSLTETEKYYY